VLTFAFILAAMYLGRCLIEAVRYLEDRYLVDATDDDYPRRLS
jgi:hypothetical protein